MNNYFDYMEGLEDKQVKMVVHTLKEGVNAWWDRIQATNKYFSNNTTTTIRESELLLNMWMSFKNIE